MVFFVFGVVKKVVRPMLRNHRCLLKKGDRPERQRRSTMTSSGPWDFLGAMFKGGDNPKPNRIYRKNQANGGQYTLRYLSQEFLGTDIFLP